MRCLPVSVRTIPVSFLVVALSVPSLSVFAQDEERSLGLPLVKTDSDYTALLNEARKAAQREDYADAVELYQGLIERGGDVVFESARGLYLPIAEGARRGIAELSEKGLHLYLSLYEPVAQRAVNEAIENADLTALLQAASQYSLTASAARAHYMAGVHYFDRGEFALAARYLRKALASPRAGQVDGALVRSRLAVVLSRLSRADEIAALEKESATALPTAKVKIGGREHALVEFIKEQAAAIGAIAGPTVDEPTEWRMQGGNPSGTKLMADSDFALNPQWVVSFGDTSYNPQQVAQYRQNMGISQELELIPSPLVIGNRVLVRSWDALHDINAFTGAREQERQEARLDINPNPQLQIYDTNRWAMSSDGVRIYYLERFPTANVNMGWGRGVPQPQAARSNFLVARDLATYKIVWRLGGAEEPNEWLRSAVFVTAPTPSEGRLFLLAEAFQSLHLVCLDAETGALIWKSHLSSLPPRAVGGGMYGYITPLPNTSPAVSGDSVVCITNGGVLASFDRSTGDVRWVVQYPSSFNQMAEAGGRFMGGRMQNPARFPQNPLIIYNDAIYTMPADSETVASYDLDSGKTLWSVERGTSQYLAGISKDRLVLAGSEATCLTARDGKILWRSRDMSGIAQGRPAMSEKFLYISQRDQGIARVDLENGSTTLLRPSVPNSPLGSLILLKDKLIVTTPMGVAAYLSYEGAFDNASKIIASAANDAAKLPELYRQRAVVSFNCLRFDKAVEDFRKAAELARAQQQTEPLREYLWQLTQAHVQRALKVAPEQAAEQLNHAAAVARDAAFADSDFGARARSEVAFTAAVFHEAAKNYPQAVAALQEVLDSIPEVALDAPNYRVEDGRILTGMMRITAKSSDFARQEIGRLIKAHGAAIYTAQDAAAKKMRAKAAAANNVPELVEVARRYPFSSSADGALQDAAEFHFKAQHFAETEKILSLWRARYQPSNMPPHLLAALALTYENQKRDLLARRYVARLNQHPHDRSIQFANYRGTVEHFLQAAATRLNLDLTRLKTTWTDLPGDVQLPLARAGSQQRFNTGGVRQLLVDADSAPVIYNDNIVMLEPPPNAQIAALNPRTLEPQWKALADFNPAAFAVARQWPPQQLISRIYEDTLVVADRDKVIGINAQSGKRQWVVPVQRPAQNTSAIFGGNHVFATDQLGKITAIDPVGGKRLWEHAGRSPSNFLQIETGAEHIAVIGHSQIAVNFINQRGGAPAHPRLINVQPQPRAGFGPSVTVVTCVSTATGKVTGEFRVDSNQDTQWRMTENDQLILQGSNFVRCYSPSDGKVLWEAAFRDGMPRFLVASEEFAICAIDAQAKQDIVAIDLETGKIRWRRTLEDKGRKMFAITAVVQRDQVVISGAMATQNMTPQGGVMNVRRVVNQQGYTVQGPRIAAIGLSDGSARHVSKLTANVDDVNWQWIQTPVVTENQIITVVKQQMGAPKVVACINDANSGAPLQEISVDDADGKQPAAANPPVVLGGAGIIRIGGLMIGGNQQGFHSAGNAAVANGVLVIEGSDDIVTFGSGK